MNRAWPSYGYRSPSAPLARSDIANSSGFLSRVHSDSALCKNAELRPAICRWRDGLGYDKTALRGHYCIQRRATRIPRVPDETQQLPARCRSRIGR